MQRPEVGSREVCGRSSKEASVAGGEGASRGEDGDVLWCVCLFLPPGREMGTCGFPTADGMWGGGLVFR